MANICSTAPFRLMSCIQYIQLSERKFDHYSLFDTDVTNNNVTADQAVSFSLLQSLLRRARVVRIGEGIKAEVVKVQCCEEGELKKKEKVRHFLPSDIADVMERTSLT